MAIAEPLHTINGTFNYHVNPKDPPPDKEPIVAPEGSFLPQSYQVYDIRDSAGQFSIDKQGFQLVKHDIQHEDVTDALVRSTIYPEVVELVKKTTGASGGRITHHTLRGVEWPDLNKKPHVTGPAKFVHFDYSDDGADKRFRACCTPEEYERLSKTRWGVIVVWIPLARIDRDPLGICDASSVPDDDIYIHRVEFPNRGDFKVDISSYETGHLFQNPEHKWYYASRMETNECLFMKAFDSKKDGRARRVPHVAFQSPFDEGEPRKSVEVRCLTFWEDQERD